jgi:ankyrin repeat protein
MSKIVHCKLVLMMLQVVEMLLEAGANVDYCDADQRTALRAAAWGGHDEIVTLLLKAGADVSSPGLLFILNSTFTVQYRSNGR